MPVKIRPIDDKILVSVIKEERSAGGILLPDNIRDAEASIGLVLAVGPGRILPTENARLVAVPIKVGDKVVFHPHAGIKLDYEGQKYKFLGQGDIMGVIEK